MSFLDHVVMETLNVQDNLDTTRSTLSWVLYITKKITVPDRNLEKKKRFFTIKYISLRSGVQVVYSSAQVHGYSELCELVLIKQNWCVDILTVAAK